MLQGRNSQENNLLESSHGFGSNLVKQEKESPRNQTWENKYEKPRQYRNSIGTIYIPGNSSTNANLVPLGSKSRSSRGGDNKSEKDSWYADPQARSSVERERLWERGRAEKERQLRELQGKQAKVQPGDRGAEDDPLVDGELGEDLPVKDDSGEHSAEKRTKELEAESLPGGHGEPGVAHAV